MCVKVWIEVDWEPLVRRVSHIVYSFGQGKIICRQMSKLKQRKEKTKFGNEQARVIFWEKNPHLTWTHSETQRGGQNARGVDSNLMSRHKVLHTKLRVCNSRTDSEENYIRQQFQSLKKRQLRNEIEVRFSEPSSSISFSKVSCAFLKHEREKTRKWVYKKSQPLLSNTVAAAVELGESWGQAIYLIVITLRCTWSLRFKKFQFWSDFLGIGKNHFFSFVKNIFVKQSVFFVVFLRKENV